MRMWGAHSHVGWGAEPVYLGLNFVGFGSCMAPHGAAYGNRTDWGVQLPYWPA